MLIKKINNGVQVIFTNNKDNDILSIANSIGCTNANGTVTNGTQLISHYTCTEQGMNLPCSIIQTQHLRTYILPS